MSSAGLGKRIDEMSAAFEAALAEPVDGTAAERAAAAHKWEVFKRRCAVMDHRIVASLGELPVEELGEPSVAAALSTLLRISREESNR
jgi:hypothetical protein